MQLLRLRLFILTIIQLMLFSASWLLSKKLVQDIPPLHAAGLRLAVTSITLWIMIAISNKKEDSHINIKKKLPEFILLSLFGFSVYFASSFKSLEYLNASELTVILSLIPGITYIIGMIFGILNFSFLKCIGIIMVTISALVFNAKENGFDGVDFMGLTFAMLAVLSYSLYGLLSRRFMTDVALLPSLAWITLMAALTFVPFLVFDATPIFSLTTEIIMGIILLGAIFSTPVYIIYQKILREGGVVYANTIGLLAPVFVFLPEYFLKDAVEFSMKKLLSIFFLMVGAYFISFTASSLSTEKGK